MATTSSSKDALDQVGRDREQIVRELGHLSEADCKLPADWNGIPRNVNFLLRAYSLHELDHLQHLHKLLAGRGRQFSEAQILLSKAQALRGELTALVLSLSDEEFEASGPGDAWSVRQLVEHLRAIDARYAATIKKALEPAQPG